MIEKEEGWEYIAKEIEEVTGRKISTSSLHKYANQPGTTIERPNYKALKEYVAYHEDDYQKPVVAEAVAEAVAEQAVSPQKNDSDNQYESVMRFSTALGIPYNEMLDKVVGLGIQQLRNNVI